MKPCNEIVRILEKEGVDLVATLPCDKVRSLYSIVSERFDHVPMTREEEGVGICAGAYLAGGKPLMLIQSSGMGNMINALGSLTKTYQLPLPILISWRGVYKEKIQAQVPMGKYLPPILEAFDIDYSLIEGADDIYLIGEALKDAYQNERIHAVLLSPRLWETCCSDDIKMEERMNNNIAPSQTVSGSPILTRYEMIKSASPYLDGRVVVCNLGIPSKELYNIKDQSSNFYMLGSMGMASPIGLGIALKTNRQVIVIDGDGSLLMNPGTLATIAYKRPQNLTILAVDNGVYGSTGSQPTHTNTCVDLGMVARGFGIENTYRVYDKPGILNVFENLSSGPNFVHAIARPGNADVPNIPLSPLEIKHRVMEFLRK